MKEVWINRVKHCPDIPGFCDEDEVFVDEIGDGNLNDVARLFTKNVKGEKKSSIIVKHSLPYVKCLGPDFPCTEERTRIEFCTLEKFHSLSPGSVPRPYIYDQTLHSLFMEDLYGYRVMREELIAGCCPANIVESVAQHLAQVHTQTHVANIGPDNMALLVKQFENREMVQLTENYVFTFPFKPDGLHNSCSDQVAAKLHTIYEDQQVLDTAARMLKLFLEKKECLLHGDLHTGSILVNDTDSRMFDVEFVHVGPAAFDVGMLLANFIFVYYRHMSIEENNDEHRAFAYQMVDVCKLLVSTYMSHMTACVENREEYEANLVSEMAGFAGCEIVRRLVGAAHNADLEGMPGAESDCFSAGVRLLQAAHRIHDADRLMVIALMLA
ncbi:methylthioribose kinase-like isoform X1 [Mya arenaria]|uniref:methylthioribose kinase-like isoform X1 n=1 Tax=Mya arenaria TaxID=6604 RepID=UPI0022E12E5E|nr:methylthioribose kinase-like isoform X1 [Mya arenaria]